VDIVAATNVTNIEVIIIIMKAVLFFGALGLY